MKRFALVCLCLPAGCSLLFDPSGVVPSPRDAAALEDLHFSVDDLSAAPPDLAVAPPDLSPDLLTPDLTPPPDLLPVDLRPCVPPVFVGFFDGGSPDPLDCNTCGCTLDKFDNANTANKFLHSISAGWSEQNDGGLTMVAPAAAVNTGDEYYSQGLAYVTGDFDLQLDYQIQHWPVGGNLIFEAVGPSVDGGVANDPLGYTQIYQPGTNGISYSLLYTDDRFLDVITGTLSGTVRVRRTGTMLCSSIVGHDEQCHSGTSTAPAYIVIYALTNSAACGGACDFRARVANLRLAHGSMVSKP